MIIMKLLDDGGFVCGDAATAKAYDARNMALLQD
jgi:hypothetical protein